MIALRTVPSSSLPALAGQTFKPPSTPPSRHPSTASPTRRNSGSMLQLSFLSRNTSGAASCLAHGTRLHGSVLCYELINNVRLDFETHLLTPQNCALSTITPLKNSAINPWKDWPTAASEPKVIEWIENILLSDTWPPPFNNLNLHGYRTSS